MIPTRVATSPITPLIRGWATTRSIFSGESLKNRWLVLAAAGSFAAHLAVLYVPPIAAVFKTVPLSLEAWAAVLVASLVPLALIDVVKVTAARRRNVA